MMANCAGSQPSRNKLYSAGESLRAFKSPVPPKMTKTVGGMVWAVVFMPEEGAEDLMKEGNKLLSS